MRRGRVEKKRGASWQTSVDGSAWPSEGVTEGLGILRR